jgi:hypothetical protein
LSGASIWSRGLGLKESKNGQLSNRKLSPATIPVGVAHSFFSRLFISQTVVHFTNSLLLIALAHQWTQGVATPAGAHHPAELCKESSGEHSSLASSHVSPLSHAHGRHSLAVAFGASCAFGQVFGRNRSIMRRVGLNPKDLPRVVALATVFMCVCVGVWRKQLLVKRNLGFDS